MENKKQLFYLILILLTILDLLFMTYILVYPNPVLKVWVIAFDLVVCAIMWVEFIYSYLNADDKKTYLKNNSISILGMLPVDIVFFRALRLIKLVQLIKLFVLARETRGYIADFLKHTYLDRIILAAIIFIFSITVLVRLVDPNMPDIFTALWYTIVSMTGTGYGDVVPATHAGKLIGMVAMVGGFLIFATITAVISSVYMSKISKDNHDDLESKIDELTAEIEKLNKKIDDL